MLVESLESRITKNRRKKDTSLPWGRGKIAKDN